MAEKLPSRKKGSHEAIIRAAERLFLERGFGGVSMDELAAEAGVARRTLYNQFPSKEDIFREMLLGVSARIGDALPPGIETQGDVETVLRLIAKGVLAFQAPAEFVGLLRMTVADARQFPWITTAFDSVLSPYLERFTRYLSHMTSLGVLNCPDSLLAAQQFLGLLNGATLWPRIFNPGNVSSSSEAVAEQTVQMFLLRYRVDTSPQNTCFREKPNTAFQANLA